MTSPTTTTGDEVGAQAPPGGKRSWLPWLLVSGAALVFVVIAVRHTGFVRDDWNHYYNMRLLHDLPFTEAIGRLATNDWFGAHELRIFFGSFLTHYLFSPLGPAASTVAYGVIAGMHAATALMTGVVLQRLTRQQIVGIATAGLMLVMPMTVGQALWINNLFFVQPLFLLAVVLVLATTDAIPYGLRAVLMSLVAIACQFSGEATVPVLYVALVLLAVAAFRRGVRQGLWSLLPLATSAGALILYLELVVTRPPAQTLHLPAIGEFGAYLARLAALSYNVLDATSGTYGVGGVAVTLGAIVGAVAVVGLISAGVIAAVARTNERTNWGLVGSLFALLFASMLPMAVGMVTGDRPVPDYRYLYVPGSIGVVIAAVLGWAALNRQRWGASAFRALAIAAAAYFTLVTVHNVVDVWGLQRSIDARIWGRVDTFLAGEVDAIVTYHPDHPYLMSPNSSGAISDFQADWGINGKRQWLADGTAWRPIFQDARLLDDGTVALLDYYNGQVTCLPDGARVLYVSLDYGQRFSGFLSDPLLVSESYSDFATFRESMRPYAGVVKPWPTIPCGAGG